MLVYCGLAWIPYSDNVYSMIQATLMFFGRCFVCND
jgi:hypothetical protein